MWLIAVIAVAGTSAAVDSSHTLEQCGSCHVRADAQMAASVHAGRDGTPMLACTDCHASHGASNPLDANAPLRRGRDLATCGACHASELTTFWSTFHGKHAALGKANVPTCAFCHAGHEVPRSNASSPLAPRNVARTCAGCHADGPAQRAAMTVALTSSDTGRYLYRKHAGVRAAGFALGGLMVIVLALGIAFLLHWIRVQRGEPKPAAPVTPRGLRIQLGALVVAFVLMDQSGIALLYAAPANDVVGSVMNGVSGLSMSVFGSADTRSLLHRLGAVALVVIAIVHLASLLLSASVRRRLRLPHQGWSRMLVELRRGARPGAEPSVDLWPIVYRVLLVGFAASIATGMMLWGAFPLMQSSGFGVVRYADTVHEWMGRTLAIALYGIVLGGGLGLAALAALRQRRARGSAHSAAGVASVLVIAAIAGCTDGSVPARSSAPLDSDDIPLHGSTVGEPLPGTTPRVFPSAETCRSCHEREYAEWRQSFHSQSVNANTFRSMYTIFHFSTEGQQAKYCFYCHAPESKFLGVEYIEQLSNAVLAGDPLPSEGVTCASCHMITEVDPSSHGWSAPARYEVASAPPYHELFKSQVTSSSALCSGCHDYDNLNLPHPDAPTTPCCTVYRGWEQTPAAKQGVTCQDCHMGDHMDLAPKPPNALYQMVGLHRYLDDRSTVSHVMPGSRSEEMLRKAVAMRVVEARVGDGHLHVVTEIENRAGHNIPDG